MSTQSSVSPAAAGQAAAGSRPPGPRPGGAGTGLAGRIVAAAAELLDETGSESALTLRGIARRAGVSAPAIYGHYPDVASILLVVVQEAFAELSAALHAAAGAAYEGPAGAAGVTAPEDRDAPDLPELLEPPPVAEARLRAVCEAYLQFAATRPQRYRVMFGGLWTATRAIESASVDRADVEALGQDALAVITSALQACVAAGASTSTDVPADAVALWLGLHGLAHQRVVTAAFPWPYDIDRRVVTALAHLTS